MGRAVGALPRLSARVRARLPAAILTVSRTPGAAARVPGAIVWQMAIVRRNRPKNSARLVRGDLGQLQVAACSAKLESPRICCTLRCTDTVRTDIPSGNPAGSRLAARTILSAEQQHLHGGQISDQSRQCVSDRSIRCLERSAALRSMLRACVERSDRSDHRLSRTPEMHVKGSCAAAASWLC